MRLKRNKTLLAGAVTAAMFMAPAFAQQQEGFVDVRIEPISAQLATSVGVEQAKLPATVKAPIGVAATVCNKPASELTPQAGAATAECTADTSSTELEQIVRREVGAEPGERKGQSMIEGSSTSDMSTTSGATSGTASPDTARDPTSGTAATESPKPLGTGTTTESTTTSPDSATRTESEKAAEPKGSAN